MEKISIVIPAYNEEKYIERTLKSINNQTYKNVETIVVCNGCIDNTEEISRKYANKVIQLKERNVSKARNSGAEISEGEILIFLDADTILEPEVLENIYNNIKENNLFGTCKVKVEKGINGFVYCHIKNMLNGKVIWSSGLIYCKKNIFYEAGKFDERKKTKGEVKDFLRRLNKLSEYRCLNSSYVIASQRRLNEWGLFGIAFYWLKEHIKPSKKEYNAIR